MLQVHDQINIMHVYVSKLQMQTLVSMLQMLRKKSSCMLQTCGSLKMCDFPMTHSKYCKAQS